ncbi:MAG: DUF6062 family protein [Oscillospiraceae bacterium]|jgi:hypothetical protein|nr:DUF6062 family protein [Oscillospiraceae bacterium]
MRSGLLAIPLDEAFAQAVEDDTCPLCVMLKTLELRVAEYVTGPAMMEPDFRTETNSKGFCNKHLKQLLEQNNRLGVALILSSYLSINKPFYPHTKRTGELNNTCFSCEQIDKGFVALTKQILVEYKDTPTFAPLVKRQKYYCLPHYNALISEYNKLPKKIQKAIPDFPSVIGTVAENTRAKLETDIKTFCKSFDYRNIGKALSEQEKISIENTMYFLTGEK